MSGAQRLGFGCCLLWLLPLLAAVGGNDVDQKQLEVQGQASCRVPSLGEIFLHSSDEDVIGELFNHMSFVPRVLELNETSLEQALRSLWVKENGNVMVLFYASWCPFSKQLQPLFEALSSVYPAVYHIAIEESTVRPSVLSKYGVNSFPALICLTKTSRTRYHGAKNLKNLVRFYRNMTGIAPDVEGNAEALTVHLKKGRINKFQEVCPYPQAISPEKWLQDDTYLTLATCFLVFRVVLYFLPFAAKNVKWWWRKLRSAPPALERRHSGGGSRDSKLEDESWKALDDLKGSTVHEAISSGAAAGGNLAWASSSTSFAPVAIAESSSSSRRIGPSEDLLRRPQFHKAHK